MPEPKDANPLLSIQFRVPFDRIRAAGVEPAIGELLAQARARLAAVAAEPVERTFANTMLALDLMTELLAASVGGSIELRFDQAITPPVVKADRSHLEQVLLNLLHNAIEASSDGHGTAITLRARRQPRHIVLEVEDEAGGGKAARLVKRARGGPRRIEDGTARTRRSRHAC